MTGSAKLPRIPWVVVGNLSATLLRLGLLFLVGREVARHLGPEGIVAMGQLQNLLGLGLALPSLALHQGILQALGSATEEQVPERSSWALMSGQFLAIAAAIAVSLLAMRGVVTLPGSLQEHVWMLVPGVCTMALVGNLQALAAGRRRLARANLFIAASGPLQALWLFGWIHCGIAGLGPGVVLFGLVAAPVALSMIPPGPLVRPRRAHWKEQLKLWAPLAAMGSVVALLAPLRAIVIRETLLSLDLATAGNWQAATRLAELVFATWAGAFTTWALPRLSGPPEHRPGIAQLSLGPVGALAIAGTLAALSPLAIQLAYVGRFPDAIPVLRWQCLAEFLQATNTPLGLILVARRDLKTFALLEIGATLSQMGMVRILAPRFGSIGAPMAVAMEAVLYLGVAILLVRRREVVPLAHDTSR